MKPGDKLLAFKNVNDHNVSQLDIDKIYTHKHHRKDLEWITVEESLFAYKLECFIKLTDLPSKRMMKFFKVMCD